MATTNKNKMDLSEPELINLQAPSVFAIPRPYDEDDRRDFNWYKKMLRLDKETKMIKLKMVAVAKEYAAKKAITQQIIDTTVELNKKFIDRSAGNGTNEVNI